MSKFTVELDIFEAIVKMGSVNHHIYLNRQTDFTDQKSTTRGHRNEANDCSRPSNEEPNENRRILGVPKKTAITPYSCDHSFFLAIVLLTAIPTKK